MNSSHIELRERRIRLLEHQIRRLESFSLNLKSISSQWSRFRLLSFAAFLIIGAFVLINWGAVPWAVATLFLLSLFSFTVWKHRQIEDGRIRCQIWLKLKQEQLARMNLDWGSIPLRHQIPPPPDHPFAVDLDLTGKRSLMHLIDRAVTAEGSMRLQDWLLAENVDPQVTLDRQLLVKELIQIPAFADRLAFMILQTSTDGLAGLNAPPLGQTDVSPMAKQWSGLRLLKWLESKSRASSLRPFLLGLILLSGFNLLLLALYLFAQWPPLFIATWVIYAAISISQSRKLEPLFRDAAYLIDNLRQLAAVLGFLENRPLSGMPRLMAFFAPLTATGKRPSQQLKRANRLFAAVGLRYNPFVALLLNALVPWDVFFAFRLDQFKKEMAASIPVWLDLLSDLEALNSLASIRALHIRAAIPEILLLPAGRTDGERKNRGGDDPALKPFVGYDLRHPLIPPQKCVPNDFIVENLGSVALITGSNMAGKSSFLRTLGVNIRLAMCGGPVLARELRLVPWRIVASVTVTDSLADGYSFFYAEVRRLKSLLEELYRPSPFPLFFLIDEIFRGTNNRERLIGSRSYLRGLTGHFGAGVIATHDLELVQLADSHPEIENFHFRDAVENGRMVFDYQIRPGPCPTTNALKIMRLAGLPVEDASLSG